MFYPYYLVPELAHPTLVDSIIERGLQLPLQQAATGLGNERVDEDLRVSTVRWFDGRMNSDIVDLIRYHVNVANRQNFAFDISFGPTEMQFTEYHSDVQGKYDWHHDVFWHNPRAYDRKLSFILQLSDPSEYEGGDVEFREVLDYNPSMFKQKGQMVIFPSFFVHRVTPVTKGTRYSLVSWVDGPKFR